MNEGVVLGRALDLHVDRRQEWKLGVLSLASIDGSRLEAEFKAKRKLVLIPLHLCGPWLRLTLCQIPQLLGSDVPHRPCSEQEPSQNGSVNLRRRPP
jgi:hypothetical protein